MYTKKIKASWIIEDCIINNYDFIVIRIKFKDDISNFFIESNKASHTKLLASLKFYNDNLINDKNNSEIISIVGAFYENSLNSINQALDENTEYINDPDNE